MSGRTGLMGRLMRRRRMMEAGDPIAAGRAAQGKKVKGPSIAASAAGLSEGRKKKKNSRSEY